MKCRHLRPDQGPETLLGAEIAIIIFLIVKAYTRFKVSSMSINISLLPCPNALAVVPSSRFRHLLDINLPYCQIKIDRLL